jgi:hypothetical protein
MNVGEIQGDGTRKNYQVNQLAVQEAVKETAGHAAEYSRADRIGLSALTRR